MYDRVLVVLRYLRVCAIGEIGREGYVSQFVGEEIWVWCVVCWRVQVALCMSRFHM